MMDDSSLTQVFATVLAGVLIFLTLEGRLGGLKESNKEIRNFNKKELDLRQEVLNLETQRRDLVRIRSKIISDTSDENKVKDNDVLSYDKRIQETEEQIQRLTDGADKAHLDSTFRKATNWDRLVLTKTERIITLSMIVLLSGSVIVMILASTVNAYLPIVIQQGYRSISSVIFSISIILLIIRVYLHGKDISSSYFD